MKTLREIEFEIDPGDDLYKCLDGNVEEAMALTQEEAVKEEVAWELGSPEWFDFFEGKIKKFGGRIVWDEEE
jgi:hypothetical protein